MHEETLVKNILRYQPVLEGMLTAIVRDGSVAEDLFQEAAIVMMRKRKNMDEDGNFLAWSRQIALNIVRDYRKSSRRQRVQFLDDSALESIAAAFEKPRASYWEDRRLALADCMEKLPDRQREILTLRYDKSEPIDRIAALFKMTRESLYTLCYKIRKSLLHCVETRLGPLGAAQ